MAITPGYTLDVSGWELRHLPEPPSPKPQSIRWRSPGRPAHPHPYLELVRVVEVYTDGGHQPGLEESGQDLLRDGVGDEVEMQGVPPVGSERRSQERESKPLNSTHRNTLLPAGHKRPVSFCPFFFFFFFFF